MASDTSKWKEHKGKIIAALVAPLLGFGAWAADAFVNQRVESKVAILDKRLDEIDKKLAVFEVQHEDIHEALKALREDLKRK